MSETVENILEIPAKEVAKPKKKLPQVVRNIRMAIGVLTFFSARLASEFSFFIYAKPRKSKKKTVEPILEEASVLHLPYKNGKLKVYSWGASDKRVLLMHGWESKSATFREMIPVLLAHNFTVVALDAPAHGGSSGNTTNFIDWGEAVVQLLDYYEFAGLPIRNVVSHSFGGSAIFHMLNMRKMELDKFVTISSPMFFYGYFQSFNSLFGISSKVKKLMLKKMDGILGRSFMDFHLYDEAHMAATKEIMMVHDQDDPVISVDHLEKMKYAFDKPQFLITKGLGHYQIIKNKMVIENIARFLTY